MPTSSSILVVDDDYNFRDLLVSILDGTGFTIAEARSAKEAMAFLSTQTPIMAIVDFRLPDMDGMTLISRMREAGQNMPIVFISGTWCDARTFTRLRNILRVSLVLQKPIQPELFLEQIDTLLPAGNWRNAPASSSDKPSSDDQIAYEQVLQPVADQPTASAQPRSESSRKAQPHQPTEDQEETSVDAQMLAQLIQLRKRLEVEAAIKNTQLRLRKAIPPEWEKLTASINSLHEAHQGDAFEIASTTAHKLRGTAGSLGMHEVSKVAGRLEDFLGMLDPTNNSAQEFLWTQIFLALAEGEATVRDELNSEFEETSHEGFACGKMLFVARSKTLKELVNAIGPRIQMELTQTENPVEAIYRAKSINFSAAVIDLGLQGKNVALALAKELRKMPGNERLPIAFVTSVSEQLRDAQAVYWGSSGVIRRPVKQAEFEKVLHNLATATRVKQPRILTIDDDAVLTKFIDSILSSNGYAVSALNEPIQMMEVLDSVNPDLILLDVVMPGLSGYDVCRVLRCDDKWTDIPVIFLTSKTDTAGRAAAFKAGANDFLSKPVLSEELIARVQSQMEHSRFRRHKANSDELTGLLNEEAFFDELRAQFKSVRSEHGSLHLCMFRIDFFEQIDKYGVFAGLEVASAMGKLLNSRFKADALRGRVDNNTFAIALFGSTMEAVAESLIYLSKEFEQHSFVDDNGKTFTAAITLALATFPDHSSTCDALIEEVRLRLANNVKQKDAMKI